MVIEREHKRRGRVGLKNNNRRSLRLTVLAVIAAVAILFAGSSVSYFLFAASNMLPRTGEEELSARAGVISGLLDFSVNSIYSRAYDIAARNETARFINGAYPDYIENHRANGALGGQDFHYIIINDLAGDNLYTEFYDSATLERTNPPEGFIENMREIAQLALRDYSIYKEQGRSGIYLLDGVVYGVGAVPAMNAVGGESCGVVLVGGALTDDFFNSVIQTGLSSIEFTRPEAAQYLQEENTTAIISMRDILGEPLELRVSDNRDSASNGMPLVYTMVAVLVAAFLLFGFAMYIVVCRLVLRPIERLVADIEAADFSDAMAVGSASSFRELNSICTSINNMQVSLDRSQISIDVFQHILEGMDALICVTDPNTDKILFINSKMKQEFGYSDKAAEGEAYACWQSLYSNKDSNCESCPIELLRKNPGETIVWEEINERNGRRYSHMERMIKWAGDNIVHLRHSVDITERKEAELLQKRRLQQQELMSTISQSFITNENMHTLIYNALRMTGEFSDAKQIVLARLSEDGDLLKSSYHWYGENASFNRAFSTIAFGEESPLYQAFLVEHEPYIILSESLHSEFLSELRADGILLVPVFSSGMFWGALSMERHAEHQWTESEIQLMRMISGVISGVISRNETQDELVRVSSIVDSSPSFISYVDQHGQIEYLNRAVLNLTGYTESEVYAGGFDLLLGAENGQRVREELMPYTFENGELEFQMPIIRKDGEERIFSFLIFSVSRERSAIASIAFDITDQLRMEGELIEAKEQAERSSMAKGDFLSRMSHEMRTPMNAIIGMTNIARTSGETERMNYCLEKIDEASKHLLGVINDILDMSKIEANKFELSYAEFELEKMLTRVINVVNFRVDEKAQRLILELDDKLPRRLVGDDQRLAQVITNLLSNAVKFTPEHGSITLSVTQTGHDKESCELRFEVADTGIGVSQEQQERLFTSFEQADGGISRKFGGTGLGLAISKNIIEVMGGEIWVESELGEGARFIFTIPARLGAAASEPDKAELEQSGQQADALQPSEDKPGKYSGAHLLLAEDVDINREIVLSILEDTGIKIDCAENGRIAVEMVQANPGKYKMMFMDIHMPEIDGYEATRRIRALDDSYARQLPIVAMTANVFREDVERCLAAGMNAHIGKPINFDELMEQLDKYVLNNEV